MFTTCPWRRRWRNALGAAALLGAASCQTYEPRPLEAGLHRAAWHGRTLEELAGAADEPRDFNATDGLTLAEARLVALSFNPELRLARLQLARAGASSASAGLLDDPRLSLDVLRIDDNVPERWVIGPALEFTIPLSGRRAAERARSRARVDVAERALREAEWDVLLDVERAWLAWSAAELRRAETARFVEELDGLVRTSDTLAASGEMARAEAARFAIAHARQRALLTGRRGDAEAARLDLLAHLGLAPDAPVRCMPSLTQGAEPDGTSEDLAARNPRLARLRAEYDAAEEDLRLEVARQLPDLTLGPQYESDAGQARFGFLGGIPLPLWNRNARAIAEARVDRELARAAFETAYEELSGRLARTQALAQALGAQRAALETVVAPMVADQLSDALHLMQLGEAEGATLLNSAEDAHELALELVDARLAEATARAEAASLVGPRVSEE